MILFRIGYSIAVDGSVVLRLRCLSIHCRLPVFPLFNRARCHIPEPWTVLYDKVVLRVHSHDLGRVAAIQGYSVTNDGVIVYEGHVHPVLRMKPSGSCSGVSTENRNWMKPVPSDPPETILLNTSTSPKGPGRIAGPLCPFDNIVVAFTADALYGYARHLVFITAMRSHKAHCSIPPRRVH